MLHRVRNRRFIIIIIIIYDEQSTNRFDYTLYERRALAHLNLSAANFSLNVNLAHVFHMLIIYNLI